MAGLIVKTLVLLVAMLVTFTVTTQSQMPSWIVNNREYYLVITLLSWFFLLSAIIFMLRS